jgi:inosose dehydratase
MAAVALAGQALKAQASSIRYGVASVAWLPSLEETIPRVAAIGLDGIEPFRNAVQKYESDPAVLKAVLDKAGLTLITCSNIGGTIMSNDFLDPTKADQTISDHVAFARGFLRYFSCDHFKITVGGRRGDTPMTAEQLKQVASTLTAIGRQTADMGIRLAPHPSIGSPLEREQEIRAVMDLTDPRYVWLTTDTGHITIGGTDPVKLVSDYFPRVAEVHLKDVEAKYRGWTGASYRDPRPYRTMGEPAGGGVDFVALHKLLQDRGYKGWCSLDLDGTERDGNTGDIVAANAHYLTDTLKVKLRPR